MGEEKWGITYPKCLAIPSTGNRKKIPIPKHFNFNQVAKNYGQRKNRKRQPEEKRHHIVRKKGQDAST